MFSASVNKATGLDEIVLTEYPHFSDHLNEILELEKAYTDFKRQRSLLDYDDLLLKLQELLETQREIREQLSGTYRAVMVDEYQDTNKIQARVVRLLCANHENVMVVGDDAQSIYSFRGAHFKNIMDFPKEFPKARIFKLEENYRSTQPILNLTNEIINQAREKYPKHLFTHQKEGRPPVLVEYSMRKTPEGWKIYDIAIEGVSLVLTYRAEFEQITRASGVDGLIRRLAEKNA